MSDAGYDEKSQDRVRSMMLKKNLHLDPEAQTLEDALCLLFLDDQFDDLEKKTPEEKMIEIIRKTWKKMSPRGHAEALKLPLTPRQKALVEKALS
jgi:hypothetical protein